MTKNYYRSEYSDKQWKALIDKATSLQRNFNLCRFKEQQNKPRDMQLIMCMEAWQ